MEIVYKLKAYARLVLENNAISKKQYDKKLEISVKKWKCMGVDQNQGLNMDYLIVVDMQNDFIDGALGSSEAVTIAPYVKEQISAFDGKVFFTRDTHFEDYLDSQEDKKLPGPHCVQNTYGW